MKRAAPLVLLIACGGPRAREPSSDPKTTVVDAGANVAEAGPLEDAPAIETLAARGASDAPQMREVMRIRDATKPVDLPGADRDVCYRAAVGASRPVRARIEDATKSTRGEASTSATTVLVPPRGPACAKKGEVLRLVIEAEPGTIARAVVWQAP